MLPCLCCLISLPCLAALSAALSCCPISLPASLHWQRSPIPATSCRHQTDPLLTTHPLHCLALVLPPWYCPPGCTAAKALAKKFAALYYLLEDLLSPQKHYDWGLRAIKSVLVVAGGLLRSREGQDEQDVLFRALRWGWRGGVAGWWGGWVWWGGFAARTAWVWD